MFPNSVIHRTRDWKKAAHWLDKVVNTHTEDEDGHFDGTLEDPDYMVVSQLANMYWSGGYGLDKDAYKAGNVTALR